MLLMDIPREIVLFLLVGFYLFDVRGGVQFVLIKHKWVYKFFFFLFIFSGWNIRLRPGI